MYNFYFIVSLSFFLFLYFLKPFIFAVYTFNICKTSYTNSSSGSFILYSFSIIISPFEYSFIISSINSKPNLVNLSLNATTNLFIFPFIPNFIIFLNLFY